MIMFALDVCCAICKRKSTEASAMLLFRIVKKMRLRMTKSLRVLMIIAALNIVLGGASVVPAQQDTIAGGYSETSVTDPEVLSAARFAVRRQGQKMRSSRLSLIAIRRAEVQVVAGLNYRLSLRVKANGAVQDVTAVVYKNLQRRYALSSWSVEQSPAAASNSTIEQMVKALAEAYEAKALGRLDAERPIFGRVKIIIENSLADDNAKDRFVIKEFRTLEEVEKWLRSREIGEGLPSRQLKPLLQCRNGLCTYNFDGGILHNQLYLEKISYGYRRGRPYIKTIYLLDGD